jgi:uridine kinase
LNIKDHEIEDIIVKIADLMPDRPVAIGINGLDCSGKTTFARALYEKLNSRNINCALLHIDDYNNLAVQKRVYDAHEKGAFTEELLDLYYRDSIHYDVAADAISRSRTEYDVTIIEGVFLFKNCLEILLDIKVFIPVNPPLARTRYEKRKGKVGDNRPVSVFDDIWLPTFKRYVREAEPEKKSDFICR